MHKPKPYKEYISLKIISIFFSALTLTILFFACIFSQKDKNCSQFRSGNFLYHFRGQQEDIYFSISRNDSIQTEINQRTGDVTKLAIRWTDNCKYELKLIESTAIFPDSIQNLRKSISVKNEIVSWTNDYYIFKAVREKSDLVLTDTLWLKK
jgi:hypothetical protein